MWRNSRTNLTCPVFDLKSWHSCHVIEVGSDELSICRKGMRGDRCIEIFDPCSSLFKGRFDAPVRLAHGIAPLGSRKLGANEIKPGLQRGSTLGARQSLDSEGDLGENRLRNSDVGRLRVSETLDNRRAALHQGRDRVGV